MKYISDLGEERQALADNLKAIIDTAAEEKRDFSDTEKASVEDLQKRIGVIDARLEDFVRVSESQNKYQDLMNRAAAGREERQTAKMEQATPGQLFTRSMEESGYQFRGRSGNVDLDTRALLKTDTTTGLVSTQNLGVVGTQPRFPLFDAVSKTYLSDPVASWIEEGAVPEAAKVAEGADKPEATITYTPKTAALDTYAHWKKYTRQFAMINGGALARDVETKLAQGVVKALQKATAAAIAGTATTKVEAKTLTEAIRLGIGNIEAADGMAGFVLANPADAAALDIDVFSGTLAGPVKGVSPWGVQVLSSVAVTAGTAYVVDPDAVELFLYDTVSTYITDSDISGTGSTAKSDFQANIITVLAEAFAKPVLLRPALVVPAGVKTT